MLNLRTKRTVPSHGIILLNKTNGDYVSRKEHTKAKYYILQDEDESQNWAHVKIDNVKTKFNTEDVKTKKTPIPSRIIGGKKTYKRLPRKGSSPRCPLRSHSLVYIENYLFIVEIGPILNKELEFIYRSDRSYHTYTYSQVSIYTIRLIIYINVTQSE